MRRDCQLFMDTCAVCHLIKIGRPQRAQLLQYQAGVPGERVHLDILGPFTTSESGNKYVLMIVDQFTRWLELHALPEQTAEITAKTPDMAPPSKCTQTRVETSIANCSPNCAN